MKLRIFVFIYIYFLSVILVDHKTEWRSDLHQLVKTYHPDSGTFGIDMLDGLVEAIIIDNLRVVPSSHTHESITRFVSLINEAREIADVLKDRYGEEYLVDEIKMRHR